MDKDFIVQRPANYLAKLAFFIHSVRKRLSRDITVLRLHNQRDVRVFPTYLQFPFGTKSVLGILAHACPKNKYEAFDADHILAVIQKSAPEAQLVKGSIYAFETLKNTVKTVYFEIDKRSGFPFSQEETKRIRKLLKQEIKFCGEKLVPQVFINRNEEEILRSILTLNQEIRDVADLPQVMIQFDQQSSQEATFTAIIVRVHKTEATLLREIFLKPEADFNCVQDRCQIIRYLQKKYPVEATVLKIHLIKGFSLLRGDHSMSLEAKRYIDAAINPLPT